MNFVKIKNITKLGPQRVFDLQTKNHTIIANGFVVHNCLVFQESVMELANKVAGFPKEQCDEVRRAIMKRSISGGDAAKAKAQALEDDFVKGAIKNGVPEHIAKKAYETVLYMSGYGFNLSHAVGYAFDSYITAWLMTYHQDQWLTAYLESMSNNPDDRAKAFSEIRSLGYKIVPIDINHAGSGWTILPGKQFMPSFTTVKGIGDAAVIEILEERPYKCIEDVLWDENGFWKHSKFNKRALEALINIGAFQSLDCTGEDKLFSSYAHMYEVIITHINDIKKRTSKEPQKGRQEFYRLAHELRDKVEPWSRRDLALKSIAHFGSLDVGALVEPQLLDVFVAKGVPNIDEFEEPGVHWFVAGKSTQKTTKNKKQYTLLECMGPGGKIYRMFVWGTKQSDPQIEPYSVCFGEISKSDFGFATQRWKLRILE
jgi:DNA polymerase III alpha subunit